MSNKNEVEKFLTQDDIIQMASSYQKSRVVLTAFELDIFSIIGNSSLKASEIAAAADSKPAAMERLLNALCALGYLNKKNSLYSNTEPSSRFLVKGSEEYLSRIGHMLSLYQSWGKLTHIIRNEGSMADSDKSLEYFIEAMHHRAKNTSQKLVSFLDIKTVKRVLDVGGGSGVYSMAFIKTKPDIEAVVFDRPDVTKLTEKYIAESGLTGKITTRNGDYNKDDFGTGYDLVFMSAIIHINSFEENQSLIKKAFVSLNPGGILVIQDNIMDDDRTSPGALFSINMLVNTQSGDTYTEREIGSWLENAGFGDIKRIQTGMANDLMIGKRLN